MPCPQKGLQFNFLIELQLNLISIQMIDYMKILHEFNNKSMNVEKYSSLNLQDIKQSIINPNQQQPLAESLINPNRQQPLAESFLYTDTINLKASHLVFVNHRPIQIKFRYFSPSSDKNQIKRYDSCNEQSVKQSKVSKLKKIRLDLPSNQISQIYSVADQNYSRSSRSRKRKKKTIKNIKHDSDFYYRSKISQINTNLVNQFQEFHKLVFDIKVKKKKIIKLNPNRSKISKVQALRKQNQEPRIINVNSQMVSKYETPIRTIYLADKSRVSQKLLSQPREKQHKNSQKNSKKSKNSKIIMVSKDMNRNNLNKSSFKIFLNKQKGTDNLRSNFRFQSNDRSQMNSKSKVNSHSKSRKGISVTSSSRSNIKKSQNFIQLNQNSNANRMRNLQNKQIQNRRKTINISSTNQHRQVQIIKVTQKVLKQQISNNNTKNNRNKKQPDKQQTKLVMA